MNSKTPVHSDMFNSIQQLVLSHLQANVLPGFYDFAKNSLALHDFKIKLELTEADKKVPSCSSCLSAFSLIKRRVSYISVRMF